MATEALMALVLNSGKLGCVLFLASPIGKVDAAIGAMCMEERPPANKKVCTRGNCAHKGELWSSDVVMSDVRQMWGATRL